MIIIWGSKMYGQTDEVPGLFHVATQFGHLYWVPLIPLGSYLVFPDSDNMASLPLSGKSVLLAWLRAGLMLVIIVLLFMTLGSLSDKGAGLLDTLLCGLALCAAIGVFAASRMLPVVGRATLDRARELGARGLNEQGQVLLELHYGTISVEEADEELERLQMEADERDRARQERAAARKAARQAAFEAKKAKQKQAFEAKGGQVSDKPLVVRRSRRRR